MSDNNIYNVKPGRALAAYSAEELREELKLRENLPPLPKACCAAIDWSKLYLHINQGIALSAGKTSLPKDFKQYVFEAALEAMYGSDIWIYLVNKQY
jgi:hypothetical protein